MPTDVRSLHVIPSIGVVDGGPVEVVRRLSEFLPQVGVGFAGLSTDRRLGDSEVVPPTFRLQSSGPPDRLNYARGFGAALREEIATADIVHIHAVDCYTSSVAARVCRETQTPFFIQPHGAYDDYHRRQGRLAKDLYYRLLDRRNFGLAAEVVASSSREAGGVRKYLGRDATVLPLGVAPELLSDATGPADPRNLLFLGRITEKKGLDLLLRAFALSGLSTQGVRLTVAGPIDPRLNFVPEEMAASLGISTSVSFLGPVAAQARASLLAAAAVFLLPSRDESFGIAAAEAMAAGCKILSSPNVGVVLDCMPQPFVEVVGLSDDSWASAMRSSFRQLRDTNDVAQRSSQFASSRFDWFRISQDLCNLYVRALNRGR